MASVAGVTGRQHPLPHMPPSHVQGHPNGQQDTLVLNLSDEDLAARTLYVGNLPFRVRWQDLKDLFRKVGTVARADVALWPDNRSKGHGNVVFSSPSDVQVAKDMFQSFSWMNRTLEVRSDRPFPDHVASQHAAQAHAGLQYMPMQRSVSDQGMPYYPGGAPNGMPPYGINQHKEDPGQSTRKNMEYRYDNGAGPNAAHLYSPAAFTGHIGQMDVGQTHFHGAANEYNHPDGSHMMNVPMMPMGLPHAAHPGMVPMPFGVPMGMTPYGMVPYMPPSMQMPMQNTAGGVTQRYANFPGRVLFVGNLPYQMQWQDLKDLFRQSGRILRADVATDLAGRSRGFGTVVYAKMEDAQRALQMFNGKEFSGRILKVHFDKYSERASPSLSSTGLPNMSNEELYVIYDDHNTVGHDTQNSSLESKRESDDLGRSISSRDDYEQGPDPATLLSEIDKSQKPLDGAAEDSQAKADNDSPIPNANHANGGQSDDAKRFNPYAAQSTRAGLRTPTSTPSQMSLRNSHLPGPIHIPPTNFASSFNFAQMYSSHGRTISSTGSMSPAAGPGSLMTPSTMSASGHPEHYNLGGPFSFQIPPPTPPLFPHHLLSPGAVPYKSTMDHGYHAYNSSVNLAPGAPVHSGPEQRQGMMGGKLGGLDSVAEEDSTRFDSGTEDDGTHQAYRRSDDRGNTYHSTGSGNIMAHLMMDNQASPLFPDHAGPGFGGDAEARRYGADTDGSYFSDVADLAHPKEPLVDQMAGNYRGLTLAPSSMPAYTTPPIGSSKGQERSVGQTKEEPSKSGEGLLNVDSPSMLSRGSMDSARPSTSAIFRTESGIRRKSFVDVTREREANDEEVDEKDSADGNGSATRGSIQAFGEGMGADAIQKEDLESEDSTDDQNGGAKGMTGYVGAVLGSATGVTWSEKLGFWNRRK